MEETAAEKQKLTIDSWQVDDALRTLIRAEEIKQNKELMDLVTKKAALQKKVTDELANRADKLFTSMNKE
jgi:RPA family protein